MKTFVAICVDQLGWSHCGDLPNLTTFLDAKPRLVRASYLPTLTETAHVTLASGTSPSSHGVVGGEVIRRDGDRLVHLRMADDAYNGGRPGDGSELLHRLHEVDVQTFVIAGKDKVAFALDPRPSKVDRGSDVAFRATYERVYADDGRRILKIQDGKEEAAFWPSFSLDKRCLKHPDTDRLLLQAAHKLLQNRWDPARHAFVFVGLPHLDQVGHRHPRTSEEVEDALKLLDVEIPRFLESCREEAEDPDGLRTVVMGDHGSHEVDRVVWPQGGRIWAAVRGGQQVELPLPVEHLERSPADGSPAMIFDGGTVRFWTKPGQARAVVDFLQEKKNRWGEFLEHVVTLAELDRAIGKADADTSHHENWGDVVGFATQQASLCKLDWMRWESVDGEQHPIAPWGEHGTSCDADRSVVWWGEGDAHHTLLEDAAAFFEET